MLWYLLKTWTGQEEEVVSEIRRTVPAELYKECFVIYQERVWRKQQRSIVQEKPLLPGCAFLTSDQSVSILSRIERIPAISRMIICGGLNILRMTEEDGLFLEKISGKEHVVKLSYVLKDDQGKICQLSEPLNGFQGKIDRIQWKKRYAMARHRLWGEERTFVLGIVLKEDICREHAAEKKEDTCFVGAKGIPAEELA